MLAAGENILRRAHIADIAGAVARREAATNELVLTDQRVVVLRSKQPPAMLVGLLGVLGWLFKVVSEGARSEYEIRRADFATAEVAETNALLARSRGEGYGMTWFEVTVKNPSEWVDALHRWAAGEPIDANLPVTRTIER